MKIYFYGPTLDAADKKGNDFVKKIKKASNRLIGKIVNVTRVNDPAEADLNCVLSAYKFCVMVEYNIMATPKK